MGLLQTVFWSGVLACAFSVVPPRPLTVWEQLAFALSFQFLLHFGVGFMDRLTIRDDADTGKP